VPGQCCWTKKNITTAFADTISFPWLSKETIKMQELYVNVDLEKNIMNNNNENEIIIF
jgi:hypothetical protein